MNERRLFRFLALHAIEAVGDVGSGQDELTRLPSGIATGNLQIGEIQAHIPRPRFLDGGKCRACAVAELLLPPRPTSSTRSAVTPRTRYSSRVLPILPSMSPDRRSSRIWPCAALSSASAAADNLRDSNTPAATHATWCFSGVANFVLNSIRP